MTGDYNNDTWKPFQIEWEPPLKMEKKKIKISLSTEHQFLCCVVNFFFLDWYLRRLSPPRLHCRLRHHPSACGYYGWPRSWGGHSRPCTVAHRCDRNLVEKQSYQGGVKATLKLVGQNRDIRIIHINSCVIDVCFVCLPLRETVQSDNASASDTASSTTTT